MDSFNFKKNEATISVNKASLKCLVAIFCIYLFFLCGTAYAAETAEAEQLLGLSLEELLQLKIVLGSRRPQKTDTNTMAPVDIILSEDISHQTSFDMDSMLRTMLPYYNITTQPNSDEASFIPPANMRNLSPDHTLILINGKRRHRGAVITYQGLDVSKIELDFKSNELSLFI